MERLQSQSFTSREKQGSVAQFRAYRYPYSSRGGLRVAAIGTSQVRTKANGQRQGQGSVTVSYKLQHLSSHRTEGPQWPQWPQWPPWSPRCNHPSSC